jgi:hypothetical protein
MADIDFQNGFINGFVAGSTNIEVDMVNRRDTEANWQSINPIIANGELIIVDTDEGIKIKIGDDVSHFNDLEYVDKPITDVLSQKADKSELNSVNAAQLNGKTADDFELAGAEERAKQYADKAANKVKDDLTNHSAEAYDALKELGKLIEDGDKDALEALNTVAAGKADKIHPHEISDVNGLSAKLDGIEEELDNKADLTEIQPIVVDSIRAEAGPNIGTVGTPSVSSRVDGDDVVFTFDYLKGVKGDEGEKG